MMTRHDSADAVCHYDDTRRGDLSGLILLPLSVPR